MATADAVMWYAVGLTGYSVVKVATPTFYALGDSRTPVALSALTVLANAALNIALVRSFGYRGLAAGTALTATLYAVVLMMILRARLGGIDGARLASVLWRQGIASVAMAAAAWIVEREMAAALPGHDLRSLLIRVGVSIVTASFAACARKRGRDEFQFLPLIPYGRHEIPADPCGTISKRWRDIPLACGISSVPAA